ncbi:MAG: hypothetical protein ABH808_01340 [Candidatus Kuenenbacteria bacterium]
MGVNYDARESSVKQKNTLLNDDEVNLTGQAKNKETKFRRGE